MRLDLLLAKVLRLRKKAAQQLIRTGVVAVDGQQQLSPSFQVLLSGLDAVSVEGVDLKLEGQFHRLMMMHKPKGVVCMRIDDGSGTPSVYDVLPEGWNHPELGTFGRLDKDTTGLFLLGTDGGLQQMLLHPSTKFPKSYIAQLGPRGQLSEDAVQRFAEGIVLADGTQCQSALIEVLERQALSPAVAVERERDPVIDSIHAAIDRLEIGRQRSSQAAAGLSPVTRVRVRCCEGQYHQVKRMIGECGGAVCALHRESMGPLELGTLPVGGVRMLTQEELCAIKSLLPLNTRDATERRGVRGSRTGKKRQYD